MAADQDTKGQVWKYAVPLTSGKTALVTIDGRSSTAKADEKTLLASMPALLKSLGNSSKTGMFDEAVDVDILKQSQYYKDLQTEQNNLQNASAKDAYNAVVGSTTFTNDNGTLDTSKYTTAPTPTASDRKQRMRNLQLNSRTEMIPSHQPQTLKIQMEPQFLIISNLKLPARLVHGQTPLNKAKSSRIILGF